MAEELMKIVGGYQNVLFDTLRSYSMNSTRGMTMIEPALVKWETSKPNNKRKYAVVTLKLGFVNEVFENGNKDVEHLKPENMALQLYVGVKDQYLSEDAKKARDESNNFLNHVWGNHPELKDAWENFTQKWVEAYGKAIGVEIQRALESQAGEDEENGEVGTERTESTT